MSNKNMTLTEIEKSSKEFKDTHTVSVSGFTGGGQRVTAAYVLAVTTKLINDLNTKLNDLTKLVKDGFAKQEQFNQEVLNQFKKHGWTK